MKRDSYDAYHGRNRFGTFLKVLIVVLILLLAAALAALLFLEPYVVYSSDGVRLELPFFQNREEPEPDSSAPAVVLTTPEATPTPTPTPLPDFRGVLLERTALYDGTAVAQAEQAGATAVIFDMKADDGSLGYISQQQLAQQAQVSATDPAINAAIQMLNTGTLHTVARVSCFRDNAAPRSDMALAIPRSTGNWRDEGDYRWLSPANEQARAYVVGICRELAELGFDELLLDNCGFPTQGRLDKILVGDSYDPENLTGPLEQFFRELDAVLAEYPQMVVSVVSSSGVLTGQSDGSGQTAALLEEEADRVLVAQEGEEPLPTLADVPVIPWFPQGQQPQGNQWAVLPALS
ncbi:putative glycoside hydrolase [uncultured Flavonifractor sp.]|uniref:putative glycoside hydrolase n=1 Tax=uncultured Flavonifractor sp. TaxID=1193534 RepID=UPI00262EE963|nr:putative glycoside hydrolase [uncultured Flavonifractor sp.]